jgi:hypothetical protein
MVFVVCAKVQFDGDFGGSIKFLIAPSAMSTSGKDAFNSSRRLTSTLRISTGIRSLDSSPICGVKPLNHIRLGSGLADQNSAKS